MHWVWFLWQHVRVKLRARVWVVSGTSSRAIHQLQERILPNATQATLRYWPKLHEDPAGTEDLNNCLQKTPRCCSLHAKAARTVRIFTGWNLHRSWRYKWCHPPPPPFFLKIFFILFIFLFLKCSCFEHCGFFFASVFKMCTFGYLLMFSDLWAGLA